MSSPRDNEYIRDDERVLRKRTRLCRRNSKTKGAFAALLALLNGEGSEAAAAAGIGAESEAGWMTALTMLLAALCAVSGGGTRPFPIGSDFDITVQQPCIALLKSAGQVPCAWADVVRTVADALRESTDAKRDAASTIFTPAVQRVARDCWEEVILITRGLPCLASRASALCVVLKQISKMRASGPFLERCLDATVKWTSAAEGPFPFSLSTTSAKADLRPVVEPHVKQIVLALQHVFGLDDLSADASEAAALQLRTLADLEMVADVLCLEGRLDNEVRIVAALIPDATKYFCRPRTARHLVVFIDALVRQLGRDCSAVFRTLSTWYPDWLTTIAAMEPFEPDTVASEARVRLLHVAGDCCACGVRSAPVRLQLLEIGPPPSFRDAMRLAEAHYAMCGPPQFEMDEDDAIPVAGVETGDL